MKLSGAVATPDGTPFDPLSNGVVLRLQDGISTSLDVPLVGVAYDTITRTG